MITKNYDFQNFKKSSARLSKTLKSKDIVVPKSILLESLSHFLGFKDWNVLNAQLHANPSHKIASNNNELLFSGEKLKFITDYFLAKRNNIISILEGISDKNCLLAWNYLSLIRFYKLILDNMTFLNIKRTTLDIQKDSKKDINSISYYSYQFYVQNETETCDIYCFIYNIALLLKEYLETYFEIILNSSREKIRNGLVYKTRTFHFKIDDKECDVHYLRLCIENIFDDLRVIFPDDEVKV